MSTKSELPLSPQVDTPRTLLTESLEVIKTEIKKLLSFSKQSQYVLDPDSIKALNDLTRTLVIMDKNNKDTPPDEDDEAAAIENLSDDELREIARQIIEDKETKAQEKLDKRRGKKKKNDSANKT